MGRLIEKPNRYPIF